MYDIKDLVKHIEINYLHIDKEKINIKNWLVLNNGEISFYLVEGFNETTNREVYFILTMYKNNIDKPMELHQFLSGSLGRQIKRLIILKNINGTTDGYLQIPFDKLRSCSYLLIDSNITKLCKNITII